MATTTNYSWTTPDNTAYVKDGASAIRSLGSSVDSTLFTALGGAYPGLRLIKKQTIGTGVSSVTVTNAFSATYENYKIILNGGTSSNSTNLTMRLGASTSTYYGCYVYGSIASTTVTGANVNNAANWGFAGATDTNGNAMSCDVMSPFLSKYTYIASGIVAYGNNRGTFTGDHETNASYTDFTITPGTGTITGGTIYVYGYGAS